MKETKEKHPNSDKTPDGYVTDHIMGAAIKRRQCLCQRTEVYKVKYYFITINHAASKHLAGAHFMENSLLPASYRAS